jgi:DNA primase
VSAVTDEIKVRVDLVELIGRSVQLKRSGSSYRGLCPFHQEKTPSFYVFPASHTWVCFGCGKKGSAFDWLMEREHLDFGEALRSLAQMTGVALPERRDPEQEQATQRLYALLERAQTYYQGVLWGVLGAPGRAYLDGRGVNESTLKTFGIGYAPPGGGLLRYLQANSFTDQEVVASGVAGQADDGRLYDFFRERVLFPIRDAQGRTIAFGGRALDAATPKYLNSRDTLLFHKQETLFAFDLARRSIAQERQAVIVEGYMDALMAHQHGFHTVVATLGTAITGRHLRQLARLVDEIVLALDSDAAGEAAARRAYQVAEDSLRSGLAPVVGPNRRQRRYVPDQPVRLRILSVPGAKDPDELIRADPTQWPGLVQAARPVIDFVLDRLANRYDLATGQGKAAAADEVTDILAGIADPIEQAHYVQQVAQVLRVDERAVHQVLRRKRGRGGAGATEQGPPPASQREGDRDDEYALALALRLRHLNAPIGATTIHLAIEENRALWRAIQAGSPVPEELHPFLERAEARLSDLEDFSAAKLTLELKLKQLELEQRTLLTQQRELNLLLRDAPEPDALEVLASLETIRRRMGEIEEQRRGVQATPRVVEAA